MTIEETCIYRPDKSDELFGFKTTLEAFGIQRYKKNQELANLGLEFVLHRLFLPQLPLPSAIDIITPDTRKLSNKFSDKAKIFLKSSNNDTL